MKLESLPNPNLVVDLNRGTVRPESSDGDDYFGPAMGTNGTAARTRRELALGTLTPRETVERLQWLRSNGATPNGLYLVPSRHSERRFENPWIPAEGDE